MPEPCRTCVDRTSRSRAIKQSDAGAEKSVRGACVRSGRAERTGWLVRCAASAGAASVRDTNVVRASRRDKNGGRQVAGAIPPERV